MGQRTWVLGEKEGRGVSGAAQWKRYLAVHHTEDCDPHVGL